MLGQLYCHEEIRLRRACSRRPSQEIPNTRETMPTVVKLHVSQHRFFFAIRTVLTLKSRATHGDRRGIGQRCQQARFFGDAISGFRLCSTERVRSDMSLITYAFLARSSVPM
jgi:hypothetical protein